MPFHPSTITFDDVPTPSTNLPVAAIGLRRPRVGVAQVCQLGDLVTLLVERDAVERDGHAVALHDRMVSHGPTAGQGDGSAVARAILAARSAGIIRMIVDWLAVASSVPSSAHRWTTP